MERHDKVTTEIIIKTTRTARKVFYSEIKLYAPQREFNFLIKSWESAATLENIKLCP